jgi:hypothetical protein
MTWSTWTHESPPWWVTLREARAIAKALGVESEET